MEVNWKSCRNKLFSTNLVQEIKVFLSQRITSIKDQMNHCQTVVCTQELHHSITTDIKHWSGFREIVLCVTKLDNNGPCVCWHKVKQQATGGEGCVADKPLLFLMFFPLLAILFIPPPVSLDSSLFLSWVALGFFKAFSHGRAPPD